MNHTISKTGAAIVTVSVLLFAICMLIPFDFGSYFVCIFLSIGYVIMSAGFWNESDSDHKAASTTGIIFAAIYAVIIMLVYFAQQNPMLVMDADKFKFKMAKKANLTFYRDKNGFEVDMIADWKHSFAMEAKSSSDAEKKLSAHTRQYVDMRQDGTKGQILYLGDVSCDINGVRFT